MQLREENKKLRGLGVERQAEQDATHVIASAASSIPLKDDLEMLLVLLCEVMRPRKLVSSLPSCEKTTHLLQSDYIALARGFDFLSKTSGTNEDTVGEYFEKYPAMREMSERNPVFEELLVLTSFRLGNNTKWDAAVRLILGALLSTFDTVTDIYMIYLYYSTGETGFANSSLTSLLMNIGSQLVFVFFQNRRQSKWRIFQEMLYVLTFTKPGIDVYRVVIGAEAEVGALVDPKIEMMITKSSELLCEAIPGAIIQMYAFLTGSNQSGVAVFSLVMSVFTAAFTSTGISFDFDTDKFQRAINLDFYGYVPDGIKKKVQVFVAIYLAFMDNEAGTVELSMVLNSTQVYGMIGGLLVLQVTTFAVFLRTINLEYIHTFYLTRTGNDDIMGHFLNNEDDEHKFIVFGHNKHKWIRLREDVVKWVNEKIPE
ncbi:hypothetical protein TrST_g11301 [Triparma strigata]|uniref:Uncharacterized protein n=1 Tax=Triparma strigata TaxID=1606541 RepID=A0A9W7A6B6_9STRA|nr:hypothetical protein TrST_g11301 [Triparma strigata]